MAAATGQPVAGIDAELVFSDGRRVPLLMAAVPLFDIHGNVRGSVTTGVDVTGLKRAQQALQTTTQRFHATLSSMYGAILLVSNDDRVEFANQSFCDQFGLKLSPGDLLGLTSTEIIGKISTGYAHPKEAIHRIGEIVDRGLPLKGEEVALSGGRTCLRDFIPLLLDGVPHGRVWHHIDITQRKWMEEALRDSEQRHRLLHETMLQGVVHQNAEGAIISMNPAAERILGQSLAEYLGSSSVDLEHGIIREDGLPFPGLEHPSMVSLRTGQRVRDVVMGVYNPREMDYRWINVSAVPLFHPGEDKPYEVYALFDDITERRRDEGQLRELSQRLTYHVDNSPLAVIEWGPDMRLTRWSGEAERIFGWKPDEVLGRRMEDFRWIYPEDQPEVAEVSTELQTGTNPRCFSANRNYRKDGSVVYCE